MQTFRDRPTSLPNYERRVAGIAARKDRKLRWNMYTSEIYSLNIRIATMDLTIGELSDGLLKQELEKRRLKLATQLDVVFADRELLKSEYWGFYDSIA